MSERERVIWISPRGETIEFTHTPPYKLLRVMEDSLGETRTLTIMQGSPGQHGSTAVDVELAPRVVAFPILVQGSTRAELWSLRRGLSRALAIEPQTDATPVTPGILRWERNGHDPVEIDAIPRLSPQYGLQVRAWTMADLEFDCPYPFWRTLTDTTLELAAGETGFTFPLEFPFESLSGTTQADVDNEGDVHAPVLIRVFGELTTPRIINVTTGKQIEVAGHIAAGEFLEIRTAFGDKAVELVQSDGTRVNKMSDLNLDASDFWHLTVGHNTIRLEADSNVSGTAWVTWRHRFAGI